MQAQQGAGAIGGGQGGPLGVEDFRFQRLIHDVRVCIQCIAMDQSYIFWIGTASGTFDNLDISMISSLDSIPISSVLLGSSSDNTGSTLSKRLAMKLGSQIYVSYNLPSNHQMLQDEVEKMLFKEVIPEILAKRSQSTAGSRE
mmetsp:Transcript_9547/g.27463  ORF Transcript_9547/g.27463 Transcript_9547/m.27463 type:complete len:143 (+) Transcript_9547:9-437(+)